jgi:hypothetical protein
MDGSFLGLSAVFTKKSPTFDFLSFQISKISVQKITF